MVALMGQSTETLCYTKNEIVRFKVADVAQLNDLSFVDKSILKESTYTVKHELSYIAGEYTKKVHFISHDHKFPGWYKHPDLITITKDGMKNYFSAGKGKDAESTFKDASSKYKEKHVAIEQAIKSYGITVLNKWKIPDNNEISILKEMGYTIESNNEKLVLSSSNHIVTYDLTLHIIQHTFYENGVIVKEMTYYYENDNVFSEYLISQEIIVKYERFSNGTCYEKIVLIKYENYAQCNVQPVISNVESENTQNSLKILPNPAVDNIKLSLSNSPRTRKVEIYNMAGDKMIFRKIAGNTTSLQFNISDYPTGVYIIKVIDGSEINSIKFIKAQ